MNRKEIRRKKFGEYHNPGKDQLIQEARETLRVIQEWQYNYRGHQVALPEMPPAITLTSVPEIKDLQEFNTAFEVVRRDTLSALKGLNHPCALVFASGKKAGGGWLTGAKAQEEDICRCSALWEALKDSEMYQLNQKYPSGVYSDTVIYCSSVPVFKDSNGFLPEPEVYSFLASPAVNAGVARLSQEHLAQIMLNRMSTILRTMHHFGHRDIVLGSYGCGVFKNDIASVANWFISLLNGPYRNKFRVVRFACIDQVHVKVFQDLLSDHK